MFLDKTRFFILQTRNDILTEAREWLGTPYHHQAMVKGVGADCVGFIVGVAKAINILSITDQQIAEYAGYGRLPNPAKMGSYLNKHLVEINEEEATVGDVVWMEWRANLPMHLAFIGSHNGTKTLIHALGDVGKVTEHRFTKEWENRVASYWRFPRLT